MTPESVTRLNDCHVKSGGRVTNWSANENNMVLQAEWNGMAASEGDQLLLMHVIQGMKQWT